MLNWLEVKQSTEELLDLLNQHVTLTFESQLSLKKELQERNLTTNIETLNTTINKKVEEIKNLKHIKDLGFKIEKTSDTFKVSRTLKAIIIDIIAILLGVLFVALGIYGVLLLFSTFSNDNSNFSISQLVIGLVMSKLGLTGIKFLSAIKRLFDYIGFELSNSNNKITLIKRNDLKLELINESPYSLNLSEEGDKLVLKLGDIDTISGISKNITQKMTLQVLFEKLQNFSN